MEDRLSPRCWTAPPGLPGMTLQRVSSIHESWTSSQQSPHPSQDMHLSCCCWLLVSHSVMSDSLWPHVACHTPLSSALSQGLLKFISIESVILSNHLILCSSPSHFAVNLSQHQGLFQWVASSHQVAKGLELQLQQPSSQRIFSGLFPLGLTGLISLLSKGHSRVFSGTTIQNINSSALNSFLMVQFSHLDLSIGATIALTIQKFVSKVTALHFNMLSRFVMGFPGGSDGKDSTCHAG